MHVPSLSLASETRSFAAAGSQSAPLPRIVDNVRVPTEPWLLAVRALNSGGNVSSCQPELFVAQASRPSVKKQKLPRTTG